MPDHRFGMTLADVQREHIIATVQGCGGNRSQAAKILHISIRSLRMKMHLYRGHDYDLPEVYTPYQWDDPVH
jgi:DNA-binding NtrC family response regulator